MTRRYWSGVAVLAGLVVVAALPASPAVAAPGSLSFNFLLDGGANNTFNATVISQNDAGGAGLTMHHELVVRRSGVRPGDVRVYDRQAGSNLTLRSSTSSELRFADAGHYAPDGTARTFNFTFAFTAGMPAGTANITVELFAGELGFGETKQKSMTRDARIVAPPADPAPKPGPTTPPPPANGGGGSDPTQPDPGAGPGGGAAGGTGTGRTTAPAGTTTAAGLAGVEPAGIDGPGPGPDGAEVLGAAADERADDGAGGLPLYSYLIGLLLLLIGAGLLLMWLGRRRRDTDATDTALGAR
jgi:hypothetical protein